MSSSCLTPRGSYTSDNQKFSSYPYAFDRNCPFGVTDKQIIDEKHLKICHPQMPEFQNQYSVHSHFQDLFLKPDCPDCFSDAGGPQCMTNLNPDYNLEPDNLIVDPLATQFSSQPIPSSLTEYNQAINGLAIDSGSIVLANPTASSSYGVFGGVILPCLSVLLLLIFLIASLRRL